MPSIPPLSVSHAHIDFLKFFGNQHGQNVSTGWISSAVPLINVKCTESNDKLGTSDSVKLPKI